MTSTTELLRRFRRRPARGAAAPPLQWPTVAATETDRYPGLVGQIARRAHDGITVTGVFSAAEAARAVERLSASASLRTTTPPGPVLGMPIGLLGPDSTDRTEYLDDTDRAREVYREAFGFDPHDRVADAIGPMWYTDRLGPAVEDGREYNPGQVRWVEPGRGGVRAHAGNEFGASLSGGAMSHLRDTTRMVDHLSYFVVLQRAERGGTLSVYDLIWAADKAAPTDWNGSRDDSWIDGVPHTAIDPGPGDMVLFGGGWRWHRVEPVHGTRPRLTYGGFCAPSLDGTALHFWT